MFLHTMVGLDGTGLFLMVILATSLLMTTVVADNPVCNLDLPYLLRCTCSQNVKSPATLTMFCTDGGFTTMPEHLPAVTHLHYTGNNFTTLSRISYPEVKTMVFNSNGIEVIVDGAFQELSNLHALILSNNSIKSLTSKTFQGLISLTYLNLDNNPLGEIKEQTFDGAFLPHLEILSLQNCKIQSVARGAFRGLYKMNTLTLSQNNLMYPLDFSGLPNLINLNLAYNGITNIDADDLKPICHVEHLNLEGNQLRIVSKYTFRALTALKVLNLWNNTLGKVENGAFASLSNLKELDLRDNQLTTLSRYSLPESGIQRMWLLNNPWTCDCSIRWFPSNINISTICSSDSEILEKCEEEHEEHGHSSVVVTIGIFAAICVGLAASVVFYMYVMRKKRTHKTPATAAGGVMPPYSRLSKYGDNIST